MNASKFNFGWGDPIGIRTVLIETYPELKLPWIDPIDLGYGRHEGEPELIDAVKTVLSRHRGFKHVLITAGCTQAIHAAIHALRTELTTSVHTRSLYFPFYPKMIALNRLQHSVSPCGITGIELWDAPSNPLGKIDIPTHERPFILDGAYLSEAYVDRDIRIPDNAVLVGSLGKMTGMTGLRLGFFATDSDAVYLKAYDAVCFGSIGTTVMGQRTIAATITDIDRWQRFNARSRAVLDSNRYEFSRLRNLFDGQEPAENGMFAFYTSSARVGRVFESAGVAWTSGLDCGADYYSMRFNLSRTNVETRDMVDQVLKTDKKKS